MVLEMPAHAYAIGERFVERYEGMFASAIPHIYPCLDRLERNGDVEGSANPPWAADGVKPTPRQPKRSYRVTGSGARRVRAWLASPIPPMEARRELWIRLRSVRPDDFATMWRLLEQFKHSVLASAGFVRRSSAMTLVDRLALEDHEAVVEQQLRWVTGACEHVRAAAEERGLMLP